MCSLVLTASACQAQLNWRISVKFILDASGELPSSGRFTSKQDVTNQVEAANAVLEGLGRGYRFHLTEVVELAGVSEWFDVAVADNQAALETMAKLFPFIYAYRNDAINIYINGHSSSSGICSFPGSGDIIFVGQLSLSTTLFHESGHYLDLCHTQGCYCGACDPSGSGECTTIPGDDDLADTLPDLDCWDQNAIANWSFGENYSALTPKDRKRVDDVFNNIMSYHSTRDRLTSDQLDHMTDASNGSRNSVTDGRTVFVDGDALGVVPDGSSDATLVVGGPYKQLANGIEAALAGDIVLIRPGTYSGSFTVTKAITFRATRGNAIIGPP